MPVLIIYLLKVNVALCLFYIAYRFALRPLTFYYLNRFFLVFGIIFSTCYPFIDISKLFAKHKAISVQLYTIAPNWHAVLPAVQHQVSTFNYWEAPIILFWIGAALMALRLSVQFVSLYRIRQNSEPKHYWGRTFRAVQDEVNPFSFWQDIYLNPDKHSDAELRSIIQHEEVHVRQWHTLDVLLAELSIVFYWFNPGIWFMKQAIKENLEFITDREILRSGIDEKVYQYSLVRVSALKPGAAIVNNFNFLTIKKRIMMMNKKRSSRANLTRYIVLPLIMLMALIFTVSKAEINKKSISVLVRKMLSTPIVNAIAPANTIIPKIVVRQRVTLPVDTTKPKVIIDTVDLGYAYPDNKDTVVNGLGTKVHGLKVMPVRINGLDLKAPVVVVNNKNEPINVSVSAISPDDIDAITVLKNDTLTGGKGGRVVVRLKPNISVATTASYSTGYVIASTGYAATPAKVITINDVSDDDIVYVINPDKLNTSEVESIRKLFKRYGFELNVHEDYTGDKLKSLAISLSSDSQHSAASATYSADDLKNEGYIIKITADKTTGAVSVMSHKK